MRRLRRLVVVPILAAALAATFVTPAGATGGSSGPTLVDRFVAWSGTPGELDRNPHDFDILVKAVVTADLAGALADPAARLTVFAPNDAAFIRTARSLGYTGWSEQGTWEFLVGALTQIGGGNPIPVLQTVLLYHVAPKKLFSLQVLFSREVQTLAGASFGVRGLQLVDREPDLPNPYLNIFFLDRKASNGVIHGITRVLIPADLP
jgi:uncharacterized surface protein with fasciclin (FAS1) repeats